MGYFSCLWQVVFHTLHITHTKSWDDSRKESALGRDLKCNCEGMRLDPMTMAIFELWLIAGRFLECFLVLCLSVKRHSVLILFNSVTLLTCHGTKIHSWYRMNLCHAELSSRTVNERYSIISVQKIEHQALNALSTIFHCYDMKKFFHIRS